MAGRPRGSVARVSSNDPDIVDESEIEVEEESTASRVEEVMAQVAASSLAVEDGMLSSNEVALLPPDVYHARVFARVQAEARSLNTKNIVPGGRFLVDGVWVNANGEYLPPPEE